MAEVDTYDGDSPANVRRRMTEDAEMAEAIRRRDESMLNVFREAATGNPEAHGDRVTELSDRLANSGRRRDDMVSAAIPLDMEGRSPPNSDRVGNFAANAEVAGAGGVGVVGSNSVAGTQEPAQSADEAGEQILGGGFPIVGRGGQVQDQQAEADRIKETFPDALLEETAGIGGPSVVPGGDDSQSRTRSMGRAALQGMAGDDIPENWHDMRWPERRSLASRYSDEPIRNADDADRAIQAEVDRRAAPE